MAGTLQHRGPDDAGEYDGPTCTLAMRRLSIIDLAGGHQPLFNETGTIACVCNGELYNYRSLRDALRRGGHAFATQSDVEVAIHGYEADPDGFLGSINGMFALALWDQRRGQLLLARDRVGKKPLYYARLGGALAFASELRTLLALPGQRWSVDRESCRAFLSLGYVPADRTPIREISRLPPGHLALWCEGAFTVRRYWRPEPAAPARDESQAAEALRALLRDAVELRLISDVPVGAFVSGGLDSSVVVAVAAGLLGARIPTFNISFPGYSGYDEAAHAQRVARHFGCEHHEIPVSATHFEQLPDVVWSLDEPLADPAALPTLLLSTEARKLVTVALTGEGADEVLGGYERYTLSLSGASLSRRLPGLGSLAAAGLWLRGARSGDDSPASRALRAAKWGGASPLTWSRELAAARPLANGGGGATAPRAPQDARGASGSDAGRSRRAGLQPVQLDDLGGLLANGLLTKVDRMTMAASLEARCPFLDYRIVNFGLGLPDRWKLRGSRSKVLLRRMAEALLPRGLWSRPKHTFRVPVTAWLRGPLRNLAREAAESRTLLGHHIVAPEPLGAVTDAHLSARADFGRTLWAVVTLHLWLTEAERRVALESDR